MILFWQYVAVPSTGSMCCSVCNITHSKCNLRSSNYKEQVLWILFSSHRTVCIMYLVLGESFAPLLSNRVRKCTPSQELKSSYWVLTSPGHITHCPISGDALLPGSLLCPYSKGCCLDEFWWIMPHAFQCVLMHITIRLHYSFCHPL